jgi:hypothetical protein
MGTNLGVLVNLKTGSRNVEGGDLRDVVILPFTLFFLELEGDTTDRTPLDTLHQVSGEAGDFVAEALGGDNSLDRTTRF